MLKLVTIHQFRFLAAHQKKLDTDMSDSGLSFPPNSYDELPNYYALLVGGGGIEGGGGDGKMFRVKVIIIAVESTPTPVLWQLECVDA